MHCYLANLHKIQAGRGVNAPGTPEIPETVFEELLVNALMHRDYLVSAPIRLFIFDDRIEIISPGHLPNNLTVEKICAGNSNIRNPILVSYIAKGLLPYHGLGSGIKRAVEKWPQIEFLDDHEGCLFTATVHRKPVTELELIHIHPENLVYNHKETENASVKSHGSVGKASEKRRVSVGKASGKILDASRQNSTITIPELSALLGITERSVERNIQKLQQNGLLRRVGGRKEGRWEVLA